MARRSQGPRPDGVKGPAGTPDPSSLPRMEASCLELALEGERLCKAGDFKAGVAFFEAAVQVGTANFMNPRACETITDEIAAWMEAHGVETLDEIRGCARV